MAILENDARFMKVTGILILLFLVLVTGLLVSLRLQLRQDVLRQGISPETLSQEVPRLLHLPQQRPARKSC